MTLRLAIASLLLCTAVMPGSGQPRTVHIANGGSVTLRAISEGALSFLWFYNGEPIPGDHDDQLMAGKPGRYTVIGLRGDCESELSDPVDIMLDTDDPQVIVDMQLRQQTGHQRALQGTTFHYQLFVLNNSDYPANGVAVTAFIPAVVSYGGTVGTYRGTVTYDAVNRQVEWRPGVLAPGQSSGLRISVKAEQEGRAESWSAVKASGTDPDLWNNRSSATTEIVTFRIPNLFTPNGDGQNDYFEISGLDLFPENELIIFNRWGNQIYKTRSYRNNWNGMGLPEGTYYYVLRIRLDNGAWQTLKGFITLLRSLTE